jgi:hypothetical protein
MKKKILNTFGIINVQLGWRLRNFGLALSTMARNNHNTYTVKLLKITEKMENLKNGQNHGEYGL